MVVPQETLQVARKLLQSARFGALGTLEASGEQPFVSLVAVCMAKDEPLFLLSDLARHTRNLKNNPAASLLVSQQDGPEDMLAGNRVSLSGSVRPAALEQQDQLKEAFVSAHSAAKEYAGFGDFQIHSMTIETGHLVAGFGRIVDINPQQLREL
ncbi:MAG: pyridoxamine 5'-phosphate oxidase family protein [Pseudomonadota bacterium]